MVLDFIYDNGDRPFALQYSCDGGETFTTYYYVTNYQGDVVGLLDSNCNVVARYSYNAWGELISVTNDQGTPITDSANIAHLNPLRYRGYYYDAETGFYYLQSRYYDPENCRFINADVFASTGQGFLGYNMYAYCNNTPVNGSDPCGACYHSSDMAVNCHMCKDRPLDDFMVTTINGQKDCDYADVEYGLGTIGNQGCGVVALYNALCLYGYGQDINTIIDSMGRSWHGRLLGTSPSSISKALDHFGVSYVKVGTVGELSTMLSDGGMAIVKKWNKTVHDIPNCFGGSHIVLVTYSNGTYTVYNRYSLVDQVYSYDSLDKFMGSEEMYIAGFYIG